MVGGKRCKALPAAGERPHARPPHRPAGLAPARRIHHARSVLMPKRDFLTVDDLNAEELVAILNAADEHKAARERRTLLDGRSVALIFEKPSTRTRVSFEVGVYELGGYPLPLSAADLQLGRGETIEDTGRVLSRYVHAIVLRTFAQEALERLARGSTVPVVNALSDYAHPCQALADMQTIRERKGGLAGLRLAYLGDGNNVAHSLLEAGALLGLNVVVATPTGYEPIPQVVRRAAALAAKSGGSVEVTNDPLAAAKGADVLYTDVWASMGQEREAEERALIFKPFQLNAEALGVAAKDAIVLHCLPAHRGEEITAEVIDGPSSAVFDQAENRLHAQKALLAWLMTGDAGAR
jgi:ornithine carbamoyltransferase